MRRFPATLLLCLFSFSLIGAALPSDPESRLPECCRRSGVHHCGGMGAAEQQPAGPSWKTLPQNCPYFPAMPAAPDHGELGLLGHHGTVRTPPRVQFASSSAAEASYAFTSSPSHQKRGPPLFS